MSRRAGSCLHEIFLEHLFETSWPGAEHLDRGLHSYTCAHLRNWSRQTFWQYPLGTTLLFRQHPLDIALPLWQYPSICSPALPLWQYLSGRSGGILSISHCHCGSTLRSVRLHCHWGSTFQYVPAISSRYCTATVAVPCSTEPIIAKEPDSSPRRSNSATDPPHGPEFERDVEPLFPVPYEK